jgi:hypothetical protein
MSTNHPSKTRTVSLKRHASAPRLLKIPTVTPNLPIGGFLALVYFALLAIFITAPLISVFTTHFNGDYISDTFMTSRHVWWMAHAVQTGQNPFSQPLLVYPDGIGGAYLWATPFEYFPAWLFALVMPLPAAMNLQLLIHITLNGWVAYLFARHLTGQPAPALVAGTLFAIAPALQGRMYVGHALIVLWVMLLGLHALYQLRNEWRWRWGIFGAVAIGLSAGGSLTLVVFYIAPLLIWFFVARMWLWEWDWFWRGVRVVVMSLPIWALLFIPLFNELPQNPEVEQAGGGHVLYSADVLSIISPSPFHPTWNDELDYPARVLGENLVEGATYIGIVGGFLAVIGVLGSASARGWLRLGIIAWVFSLGPLLKLFDELVVVRMGVYETYIPLPWALFEQLPLISATRAPARWGFIMALCVAIMGGYGMVALFRWLPHTRFWRWGMPAIFIMMILWDYPMFYPMPQVSAELPPALYDLAERDDVRAVFNIPYNDRVLVKQALYMQVAHGHPILAGMMFRDTPANPAKLALLQHTLDPALLHVAGVDVVIVQKTADTTLYDRAIAQLGNPTYEDATIAIFDVPQTTLSSAFTALPIAPQSITEFADAYLYAPQTGMTWLDMTLSANQPREVTLSLNHTVIHRLMVGDENRVRLPIPLGQADFYTLRIALSDPCPAPMTEFSTCAGVDVVDMTFGEFLPTTLDEPIEFSLGIGLQGSWTQLDGAEALWVGTDWHLARGLSENTLRFIHVTDSTGSLIAQNDGIMAVLPSGSDWVDGVRLLLPPNLPSGAYTISLGWYLYPSLDRLTVLNPPSADGVYTIGTIEIIKEDT